MALQQHADSVSQGSRPVAPLELFQDAGDDRHRLIGSAATIASASADAKLRKSATTQPHERDTEERAKESGDWKKLRRGWCWGPKTFREELLDRIGERRTRAHEGPEIRESEEQKAERLIGGMLRQAGWKEGELEKRAKGDKAKARIAERLRAETTMTWEWIAKRLRMGHWRTAFNATRAVSKRKRT